MSNLNIIELYDENDNPFKVQYDYHRKEKSFFNHKEGYGYPGNDAEIIINEVCFHTEWYPAKSFDKTFIESLEEKILEIVLGNEKDSLESDQEDCYNYYQNKWYGDN